MNRHQLERRILESAPPRPSPDLRNRILNAAAGVVRPRRRIAWGVLAWGLAVALVLVNVGADRLADAAIARAIDGKTPPATRTSVAQGIAVDLGEPSVMRLPSAILADLRGAAQLRERESAAQRIDRYCEPGSNHERG